MSGKNYTIEILYEFSKECAIISYFTDEETAVQRNEANFQKLYFTKCLGLEPVIRTHHPIS